MCRFMVGSELYFMRRLSLPDLAALHYDDDVSVCIVANLDSLFLSERLYSKGQAEILDLQ